MPTRTPGAGEGEPPDGPGGDDACAVAGVDIEKNGNDLPRGSGHVLGNRGHRRHDEGASSSPSSPPRRRRNRPRRRRRDARGGEEEEGGDPSHGGGTCKSNCAAHRLMSVVEDAAFVGRVVGHFRRNNIDGEDPSSSSWSSSNDDGGCRGGHRVRPWPVVCNERCGSWYGYPFSSSNDRNGSIHGPVPTAVVRSCYFKSTDGHAGTWNFSLKRLNLPFLETACQFGGCLIVDATKDRHKTMPDSLSRTVPIWCAVVNRAALRLRLRRAATGGEVDEVVEDNSRWKELHTPTCSVPQSEHEHIERLLEGMVDELLSSRAIKDRSWLVDALGSRPLRPYWITRSTGVGGEEGDAIEAVRRAAECGGDAHTPLVCVSCSEPCGTAWRVASPGDRCGTDGVDPDGHGNGGGYWYTQGGADDHEAWSRGLTPKLFWRNVSAILGPDRAALKVSISESAPAKGTVLLADERAVEDAIDGVVRRARSIDEECWMYVDDDDADADLDCGDDCYSNLFVSNGNAPPSTSNRAAASPPQKPLPYDTLGASGISVGSRRAGRPPECWEHFDAVLNVTTVEYENHQKKTNGCQGYYLQIPVREGKGDRTELERWMAVALAFVALHASAGGRVLIHCAQGRDRSVAVAVCALVLFCDLGGGGVEEGYPDVSFSPSASPLVFRPWCGRLYPSLLARATMGSSGGVGGGDTSEVSDEWRRSTANESDVHDDGKKSLIDGEGGEEEESRIYRNSGMDARLVESLLGRDGRDLLLHEVRHLARNGSISDDAVAASRASATEEEPSVAVTAAAATATAAKTPYPPPPSAPPLSTKESARSALHTIQRYRPRACPSRHTMKKVNRFLLSGEYEQEAGGIGS